MKDNHRLKMLGIFLPVLIYLGVTVGITLAAEVAFIIKHQDVLMTGIEYGMPDDATMQRAMESVSEMVIKNSMLITMIAAVVTFPVIYLIFFRPLQKDRAQKYQYKRCKKAEYLWIPLLGALGCIALNGLIELTNISAYTENTEEIMETLYSGNILVQIVAIGFAAPMIEELIYRGLLYKNLREYTSMYKAGIAASLIFAVMHGNLAQAVYAMIVSACLIFVYEKYQDLKASILLHSSLNIMSVILVNTVLGDWVYQSKTILGICSIATFVLSVGVLMVIDSRVWVEVNERTTQEPQNKEREENETNWNSDRQP